MAMLDPKTTPLEHALYAARIPYGPLFVALDSERHLVGFMSVEVYTTLGALRALREVRDANPSAQSFVPAFCTNAAAQSDVRLYEDAGQAEWWDRLLVWADEMRMRRTQPEARAAD